MLQPVENSEYLVTQTGFIGDYPPSDQSAFLDRANSLRSDALYNAIKDAEFVSSAKTFRKDKNSFRQLFLIKNWPLGLLVVGDAMVNFNPVYGQGMTTVVLCAEAARSRSDWMHNPNMYKKLQRRVNRCLLGPWVIAMLEDMRWAELKGIKYWPLKAAFSYVDHVMKSASRNSRVCYRFLSVLHLTRASSSLATPFVLFKVLSSMLLWATNKTKNTENNNARPAGEDSAS